MKGKLYSELLLKIAHTSINRKARINTSDNLKLLTRAIMLKCYETGVITETAVYVTLSFRMLPTTVLQLHTFFITREEDDIAAPSALCSLGAGRRYQGSLQEDGCGALCLPDYK